MTKKQLLIWRDLQIYSHHIDDIIFAIEENQPFTKEYCDKMILYSEKIFNKLKGFYKNDK